MSNCIKPIHNRKLGALSPEHFDYNKMVPAKDVDGNELKLWRGQFVLYLAPLTTIREWRNFLWEHLQPAVKVPGVRLDVPCYEESDGFEQGVIWPVRFAAPGTQRPSDYDGWAKIF